MQLQSSLHRGMMLLSRAGGGAAAEHERKPNNCAAALASSSCLPHLSSRGRAAVQLREDVTRFRYGDEQHLDDTLTRLFQFNRPKGVPRRCTPLMISS